jgi:hypothetical protein
MAQFDYVLTAADIGRVLDPPDGFVVKLIRTKPPVDDGPPRASPDGTWLSGRLQLRGVREFRDLYCGDSMCLEPSTRPTLKPCRKARSTRSPCRTVRTFARLATSPLIFVASRRCGKPRLSRFERGLKKCPNIGSP